MTDTPRDTRIETALTQTTVEFIHPGDPRRILDGTPEDMIMAVADFKDGESLFRMISFVSPASFDQLGEDFLRAEYSRMVEEEAHATPDA